MPIVLPSVGSVTSSGQSLPTVQVYDYLYNSGDPTATKPASLANAVVRITLQYDSGNTTTPSIVHLNPGQIIVTADANGFWSANLIPNDIITPANTVYMVKTPFDSFQISVVSTPAVQQASQIIVNAPAPLSPAATGLVGPITVTGALTVTGATTLAGGTWTGSYTLPDGGVLDTTGIKIKGGTPWYDVKAFGAAGNGVTDDSTAFTNAIAAAVGGGTVFCPPGTYMVKQGIIQLTSFITLMGAGRGATVIKLIANQAGTGQAPQATVICNKNNQTSGDVQMVVRDLTVDGNAVNQGTGKNQGVAFYRCRAAKAINVRVQDIAGSGTTTNETFMFEVVAGADIEFVSCEAVNTSTQYSTGFSADSATNVQWVDCWAINTGGMGFTHHGSQNLQYTNCRAYLCAVDGFHSETGVDVTYVNCIGGGLASTNSTSPVPWPFTTGQALGNSGQGFFLGVNGSRINVIGCVGAKNNGSGNSAGLLVNAATKVRIVGGSWHDNLGVGINFNAAVDAVNTRITGGPIIDTNTAGAWAIGGTVYAYPGGVTSPALGATGVYVQSPFPFDANVFFSGGTVTGVFLANSVGGGNGVQLGGATPVSVRIPAGAWYAVNYTVAPTAFWWVD